MMKKYTSLFVLSLLLNVALKAQVIETVENPVQYVNPLMGTLSDFTLSTGNTYPAVGLPWGMNLWTPQTGKNGNGWQYQYTAHKIRGFKQTHQPSPWMNDHGVFSIMPVVGDTLFREEDRASWFSHKTEISQPHYYKVYLADHDIWAEMTPTTRAAQFRITYPESDQSALVIDAFDGDTYIRLIPEEQKIIGYSTHNHGGVADHFKNYFVIYTNKAFTGNIWEKDKILTGSLEKEGKDLGAILHFNTAKGEQIHVKTASSFISFEQAELNLKRETEGLSFSATRQKAEDIWNKALSRIEISGGNPTQTRTFYSSYYRMLFFPQKMYERDATDQIIHYSPYNGQIEPGYLFSGTGFWDTFRALYPFLSLMYPEINIKMQKGLINAYKEGGFLPEWSSPGYRNVMVGNNSAVVVADAYLKGLRGYDIETLFEALRHGADHEGPLDAVGRKGVSYYNRLGYVPYDVGINENAARSLEYAFDDYAIYVLGKALGKPDSETGIYKQRSQNYRLLFDKEYKLMRGKKQDGSFQAPFNPFKWGDAFTEGNSWHYTWSVFHDVQGLINLMGGKENFTQMLDAVFSTPPVFDDSYYGQVIHEIREMQVAGMGQYAHGNQPAQHIIYLYNYAGKPWKAQYWVREVMNRLYSPDPDGYIGDEDNGQTSAWYVFSALGFYPVNPAGTQYVFGAPLFKKAILHFSDGKQLEIAAPDNSDTHRYIQEARLNGSPYSKNYIDHFDLLKGGKLEFQMVAEPNKDRGISPEDFPQSFSDSL